MTPGTWESESDPAEHRTGNIKPVLLTPSLSPPARKCPKGEGATGGTTSLENNQSETTNIRDKVLKLRPRYKKIFIVKPFSAYHDR